MTVQRLFGLLCVLVGGASAQECTKSGACDTHTRCTVWAEEGECIRSSQYMTQHCPASCEAVELELENQLSECKDLHEHCSIWADLGECQENTRTMHQYCKASCGLCKDACVDDNDKCNFWAEKGECESNADWMTKHCPVSCKACESDRKLAAAKHNDYAGQTADFGVIQAVEGAQADETIQHIRASLEYMKSETFLNLTPSVKENCQNRHKLCSFWSVIGECEANKAYMQTNCAPACKSCHMIDFKQRCPPIEGLPEALKPGDLNKMFERIVATAPGNRTLTDDERKQLAESQTPIYTVTVHSRPDATDKVDIALDKAMPPWVVTFDNLLTAEECQTMIDLGYEYGYERSRDVGARKFDGSHDAVESKARTSENAWCSDFSGCRKHELAQRLHERMSKIMDIPPENSEDLQLLKYEVGQFYRTHHDYIPSQASRNCGPRILTFFLYLSDVDAGGGTDFPELGITVQPKAGRAVLWPSVYDSYPAVKDPRTSHQALPVEKGTKFAANGWIHMHDYLTPQEKGCN